jgi:alkylation response protein AidB-like acyl-CoA dehydrogenase
MQFAFTAEQEMIRDAAREFVAGHGTSARLRAVMETQAGYDTDAWHELGRELGWVGLMLPEEAGGSGSGMVELAILQEEMGRRLLATPFLATAGMTVPIILECAGAAQTSRLLTGLAAGEMIAAAALTGDSGLPGEAAIAVDFTPSGRGGGRLNGHASFVVHGHVADVLLVAANTVQPEGGISVLVVPRSASGVHVTRLTTMDLTRPYARVEFHDVELSAEALLGSMGKADAPLANGLRIAEIALAAEQLGGAAGVLEMTTEYVRQRVQFGRPIGSFQAVKHRLADMLVMVEAARSAVYYAACTVDEYRAGAADAKALAEAAALVKSYCSDAFFNCASNAIQLHGGIGFTWDHDAQLYFKRARASATLLGSSTYHRRRIAELIGLDAETIGGER